MTDMQDRELWSIAVFRLREAANRIFALATRVRAPRVRSRLLEVYEQLRAEEAKIAALASVTVSGDEPSTGDELTCCEKNGEGAVVHGAQAGKPRRPVTQLIPS